VEADDALGSALFPTRHARGNHELNTNLTFHYSGHGQQRRALRARQQLFTIGCLLLTRIQTS
jgi:hypothetical protein